MTFQVLLTDWAEDDLVGIYNYVLQRDSSDAADSLLETLESACRDLKEHPNRGHVAPELGHIGVSDVREVHCKTHYRVIYEVVGKKVFIYGVLDGRRHLQTLLEERLLR